ncbi:MAG: DUF5615 family PIN-like protein [Bryobacteraceae bacterium]
MTSDKNFGDLVFRQHLKHSGILLIRLAGLNPAQKADLVSDAVHAHCAQLTNAFSVLTADSLRIRRNE